LIASADAKQHAAMAHSAALGAHAVATNHGGQVKVATAGINWPRPDPFPAFNIDPLVYLDQMYAHRPVPAWDAVAIHPYPAYPDGAAAPFPVGEPAPHDIDATYAVDRFEEDVNDVHGLIHQAPYSDNAEIWVTEVGRDSGPESEYPDGGPCYGNDDGYLRCTPQLQRTELINIATLAAHYCPAPIRLRLLAFYNLQDDGGNGQKRGVLRVGGGEKPAHDAVANFYAPGNEPTC
jgi:hypothetical protein